MNKFYSEILEQPKSLDLTLEYYSGPEGKQVLQNIVEAIHRENIQKIIFTGMGSSFFVSHVASNLFNSLGIQSFALNTSELLYGNIPLITNRALLVCISQSGESIEIVKLLEKMPSDALVVGICNEEKSFLSTNANMVLLSKAGKEEMTSTKTYTSIILALCIFGWYLSGKWDNKKIAQIKALVDETEELVSRDQKLISDMLHFFGEIDFLQFVGRGPLFATAQQSELMFKEASKVPAASTLGGEFRHGPMEMVKPGFKSILFAAADNAYEQSIKMAIDIAKFQGKVLIITNKDPRLSDSNIRVITINQPDEYLFTLLSIIPVQLMVNVLALTKGFVPGDFIHGGKVTVAE